MVRILLQRRLRVRFCFQHVPGIKLGDGEVHGGIRIIRVGLPDRYVAHGKPALLHEEVGFTGQRIAERVAAAIADSAHPAHGAGSAIIGA